MATETQTQPAPHTTVISRVVSIPLVASSLETIHSTLTNNAYTKSPYATAQGLSKTMLEYAEPIGKHLAPILHRADDLANKGLDVVESRYPYPFTTPTEDIIKDIKGRSDHARGVANKTIDERVKSPALHVAEGIDKSLAPLVDYFETAVGKIHSTTTSPTEGSPPPESSSTKYQYQRAYALSKDLSDQLYTLSAQQINQLKTQNTYVQRATEAAHHVTTVASSSYGAAQGKVHAVSDAMLQELTKVQQSTAALPTQLQSYFSDISTHLSSSINEVSTILTSSDPLNDKVQKVRSTVQERVNPILDTTSKRVQEILEAIKGKAMEKEQQVESVVNGHSTATNGHA